MRTEIFQELFALLQEVTNIRDIGIHKICAGRLVPLDKTQTTKLSLEKWKLAHEANPVYIENVPILQELLEQKKTILIPDVKNDERSAKEFFFFGIQSILIIPLIFRQEVAGLVIIASINETHEFPSEQVAECERLVEKYLQQIGGEMENAHS